MYKSLFAFIIISISNIGFAQEAKIAFTPHYAYQMPMGGISDYYGNNSNVGANLNVKLANNFTFGLEGQFLFGSQYKDLTLLGNIVTSNGFIIGNNQSIEIPDVQGRGLNCFAEVGKIFPLNKTNLNSGIHIKAGLGYMYYSAYVVADPVVITQISSEYADGYSRLQSGLSFNSFLGYTLYSKDKFFNCSGGLQITYAGLKHDGTIDFATNTPYDKSSSTSCFLIGPKVCFSLILKTFKKSEPKGDGYFYN